MLVEGRGRNGKRADGTCGSGLLEARLYRCGAVRDPAAGVRAPASGAAAAETVSVHVCCRRRFGPRHDRGHKAEIAEASDRECGDSRVGSAVCGLKCPGGGWNYVLTMNNIEISGYNRRYQYGPLPSRSERDILKFRGAI